MRKRDVPMVKVTRQDDGELWAHDHRRLRVFQELRRSGDCGKIKVEVTDQPVPGFKKSTTNGGNSVKVKCGSPDNLVIGWEYSMMPSDKYTYIGKDSDGEPMYLVDDARKDAPTLLDLQHMMR
eukprot:TRINITY_DN29070_c0_g1_i2.p1 TRINITY_DN29070_c0_g1~~TRINITY_DN29070_c0_g1_i2.p1  ORF type:complete len:123 (+),score=20.59 TRINITY_DN29070_c0_g1_i2:237-605(+)